MKFGLFTFILFAFGISNSALAKPSRHPGDLDLILRSEWDGDLKSYLAEIKKEKANELNACVQQRLLRDQEKKQTAAALIEYKKQKFELNHSTRHAAILAAREDQIRYRREQDQIRLQFAAERSKHVTGKQITREARMKNFKSVRMALINYVHQKNSGRKPAMLKMPKPDTTAYKDGASDLGFSQATMPPPMDPTMMPPVPTMIVEPLPGAEQNANMAPTFAPSGADSARAYGGSAGSSR